MSQEPDNKKLLIIKATPTSLGTVEGFLKNRDWKIKSTSNLKEALIYLVQEQPRFVMVCIDHPNRKVRNLPRILTQAFPVCVIAFTEVSSAASYNLLNTSNTEYVVYPPVTGPAVERTVNKFYKDQHAKGVTNPFQRGGPGQAGADGVIAIKGDGTGGEAQSAQSILQQLLGGDDGSSATGGPAFIPTGGSGSFSAGSAADQAAAMAAGSPPISGSGASYMTGDNSQMNTGFQPGMGPNDGLGPSWARQDRPGGPGYTPNHDDTDDGGGPRSYSHNKNSGPGWAPLPAKEKKKQSLTPEQIENDPRATKTDSIILRGTKEALDKSCINTNFAEASPIEEATNISCIVIESSRFSGYLITAMGKNKKIDEPFLAKVRERLFRFLRDAGETLEDADSMNLKIKEVPFEDWALEQAEFLRKSVHEGNEVAMAFFPCSKVRAVCGDSPDEEMTSTHLNELAGDVAVEFNVYIYLPKNKKYVLYTPRGSKFFSAQKERLLSQGVSNLHILKAETQDLDKYRAQNFLNEQIQIFEDKQKEKGAA